MNMARLPSSRLFKLVAIVALIAGSTFGVGGQRHRARLSGDLLSFEGRRTAARTRVIVRGSKTQIEAMASRHGLAIARWMDDAAVLLADSESGFGLAADSANALLSGDAPVATFMDVSNAATDGSGSGPGRAAGAVAWPRSDSRHERIGRDGRRGRYRHFVSPALSTRRSSPTSAR